MIDKKSLTLCIGLCFCVFVDVLSVRQSRIDPHVVGVTIDQVIKEHKPIILQELLKQQTLSLPSLMVILRVAEDEVEQTRAKITLRRKITSGSWIAASAISTLLFLSAEQTNIRKDFTYRKWCFTNPQSPAEKKAVYKLPPLWNMVEVAALIGMWSGATCYYEKLKTDIDDLARAQKSVTVINEKIAELPQETVYLNNKEESHV